MRIREQKIKSVRQKKKEEIEELLAHSYNYREPVPCFFLETTEFDDPKDCADELMEQRDKLREACYSTSAYEVRDVKLIELQKTQQLKAQKLLTDMSKTFASNEKSLELTRAIASSQSELIKDIQQYLKSDSYENSLMATVRSIITEANNDDLGNNRVSVTNYRIYLANAVNKNLAEKIGTHIKSMTKRSMMKLIEEQRNKTIHNVAGIFENGQFNEDFFDILIDAAWRLLIAATATALLAGPAVVAATVAAAAADLVLTAVGGVFIVGAVAAWTTWLVFSWSRSTEMEKLTREMRDDTLKKTNIQATLEVAAKEAFSALEKAITQ